MRDLAVEAIENELGLEATFGEVALDLGGFPSWLTIRASDIALDHPKHGRFAEAKELRIKPSIGALIFGTVDLDQIAIDAPSVHLIVREGKVVNLPAIREAPKGPVDIPLQKLVARGASLTVDASPDAHLDLSKVDIVIQVSDRKRVHLIADGAGGSIRHATGSETFQRYRLDADVDPEASIRINELLARTPHFHVGVRDALARIPFDGSYSGTADVKVILDRLRELPFGKDIPPMDGVVQGHVQLEGDADGPTGEATLHLANVHIISRTKAGEPMAYGLGETADLELSFDPKQVRVEEGVLNLIGKGGSLALTGSVDLDPEKGFPLDVKADINDLHFAQLLEQLGVTPNTIVQWRISGSTKLRGTILPLEISGPINTRTRDMLITLDPWHASPKRRVIGVERGDVRGRLSIRPDGVRFEKMVGTTKRSKIHADVLLGFDEKVSVEGWSSWLDLEDITPLLGDMPLAGRGKVSVSVAGTFAKTETHGKLQVEGFELSGFRLGDVQSDWQLEHDSMAVRLPKVRGQKGQHHYTVDDLYLDFRDDRFTTTGTLRTSDLQLADLYHVIRYEEDERFLPYHATLDGSIAMLYTLGHPGDSERGTLTADLALDVRDVDIHGFLFPTGRLDGRWHWLDFTKGRDSGKLTVHGAHLRKGDGVVTLAGVMDYGSKLQMTGFADQIAVRDIEGLGDRFPKLSGTITTSLDIRGTAGIPHIDMDVGTTGLAWGGATLGDGRIYVRLTDRDDPWVREAREWDPKNPPSGQSCGRARAGLAQGRWRPDPPLKTVEGPMVALDKPMAYLVCGDLANGQVKLDMAFGRTEVYPLRGSVELDDFALDSILRELHVDDELRARLSATLFTTGGSLKEDDSLVGDLTIDDLRAKAAGVEIRNQGDVAMLLKGREGFEVVQAILEGVGSQLAIRGEGSTHGGLGLEVEGDIDLAFLGTLSPLVNSARGHVSLETRIRGSIDDPTVFGQLLLRDAGFRVAGLDDPIEELNGRATFSAHRILLEDISATMAGGRVFASGSASLQQGDIEEYRVDARAYNVHLEPDAGIAATFGGETRLQWKRGDHLPKLTGSLDLEELRYTKDIQISPTIGEINRPKRVDVEPYDPGADRLAFDLEIATSRPVQIANNLLDADIVVDGSRRSFRIVGTDQRFGVVGSLDIPRGVVKLRNRELTIREAEIDLDDPTKIDPRFDIYAETEVRRISDPASPDWKISLRAHGNVDGFRLDLGSDPQMSEEDILLLLTVGMTRAEVNQLQAGELGSYGIDALSAVTGVTDEVKRTLKVIDELGIQSIYSETTNRPEPHVSVAKRVNDRVRINASTGLTGTERDVRASAVVEVEDNTTLEASYDNLNREGTSIGNVGVDLRWRLEFE